MVGEVVGRDRAGEQRLLHRPQQHDHAGAVGVVPVDVVEHLLAGVDQRMEWTDPFLVDDDPRSASSISAMISESIRRLVSTPP